MTDDASLFVDLEKYDQGKVTFGDKNNSKIIGLVKVCKNPSNSIKDVYLVDVLKFNHLSISQL